MYDENGNEIIDVKQKKLLKAKTINLSLFTLTAKSLIRLAGLSGSVLKPEL